MLKQTYNSSKLDDMFPVRESKEFKWTIIQIFLSYKTILIKIMDNLKNTIFMQKQETVTEKLQKKPIL